MKFPILDSVINGCLHPQFETDSHNEPIDYNGIVRMLKNLPSNLEDIEYAITMSLKPFVVFNYEDERPFKLDVGTEDEYIKLPAFTWPPFLDVPSTKESTPKERFYKTILTTERSRTLIALYDYVNAAAIIDSKGEICSTLTELYHLSKQIPTSSEYDIFFSFVKEFVIQTYYQIASLFITILEEEKVEDFEDFFYSLYNRYPEEPEISSLQNLRMKCKQNMIGPEPDDGSDSSEVEPHIMRETEFREDVEPFRFFEMPMVATLSKRNQSMLVQKIVGESVAYAVAMLVHIEYDKWLKEKYGYKSKTSIHTHWAKCLRSNERTIRGLRNILIDPNSGENPMDYPSPKHVEEVKSFYKSLCVNH